MKQLILILLTTMLIACKKETPQPPAPQPVSVPMTLYFTGVKPGAVYGITYCIGPLSAQNKILIGNVSSGYSKQLTLNGTVCDGNKVQTASIFFDAHTMDISDTTKITAYLIHKSDTVVKKSSNGRTGGVSAVLTGCY